MLLFLICDAAAEPQLCTDEGGARTGHIFQILSRHFLVFYQRNQELGERRKETEKRESSNSIPPCRRVCWKQEPKGVITYTPKSDMTIHLGVVAGGWWWLGGGSRPLDSLTPHCQLGLAGSYFPLCLRLRRAADKNIHNSRQADPRGVGFRFSLSFHSQKLQLS